MFIDGAEKYGNRVLEKRVSEEGAVIGVIFNNLLYLKDYGLSKKDFITFEGRFLYCMAEKLNKAKISTFTEFDLLDIFNDKEIEKFNEIGGFDLLDSMTKEISVENSNGYIDRLYRSNAIINLIELGIDVFKEVTIDGKKVVPFELFEHLSSQQVKDFYDDSINSIRTLDTNNGVEKCELYITDEFIESMLSGNELGTLFDTAGYDVYGEEIPAFPKISSETGGLIKGSLSMLAGYSSVGKSTIIISIIMALIHRGERVCIISNEQKSRPFLENILMWILVNKLKYHNINKKRLRVGRRALNDKDLEMIKKAQEIYNNEYAKSIYFVSTPTSMKIVKDQAKEHILRYGCTTIIYDTFKIDFNNGDDNFWLSLIKDSRTLFDLAQKYDVITFATIQCANSTLGQLFLDSSVLSNSKQVKEILENLYIVRDVYPQELDPKSKYYCNPYYYKKSEKGWTIEPMELDKNKTYKVLFLDKVRAGQNSMSGNYAIILDFYGHNGTVKELCLCRPKHARIGA